MSKRLIFLSLLKIKQHYSKQNKRIFGQNLQGASLQILFFYYRFLNDTSYLLTHKGRRLSLQKLTKEQKFSKLLRKKKKNNNEIKD
jgi:hypothetical protein